MDDLPASLAAAAQRLVALAANDEELRTHLRRLAEAVLAATASPAQGAAPSPPAAAAQPETLTSPPVGDEARFFTPAPARPAPRAPEPLAIPPTASPAPTLPAAAPWPLVPDSELPLIEARCRLKAEGARWAAQRRRRLDAGDDFRTAIEPGDREIIARAREAKCYLWMNDPYGPDPADTAAWEDLAACFEALAAAVALVRSVLDAPQSDDYQQAIELLAEAQSALRVMAEQLDAKPDPEQTSTFYWLRETAETQRLFIRRYMRLNDPADPAAVADLHGRIAALDATLQEAHRKEKARRSGYQQLRYHLKLIAQDARNERLDDWKKVSQAIESLLAEGIQPSNPELRELLLPVLDAMPDSDRLATGKGFTLVLRELDRYSASRQAAEPVRSTGEPTAEVRRAAELLRGKAAVLIGGIPRPHAREALVQALSLSELFWFEVPEHESIDRFEPYIARPEVAVVFLATRWSSHSYGEVVRFCDRYGKCLVRLPAGYHPNQVAAQILAQCEMRLARSLAAS